MAPVGLNEEVDDLTATELASAVEPAPEEDAGEPTEASSGGLPADAAEPAVPAEQGDQSDAPTEVEGGLETLETLDGGGQAAVRSDGLGDISSVDTSGSVEGGAGESEYGSAQDIASAIRTALGRSE